MLPGVFTLKKVSRPLPGPYSASWFFLPSETSNFVALNEGLSFQGCQALGDAIPPTLKLCRLPGFALLGSYLLCVFLIYEEGLKSDFAACTSFLPVALRAGLNG